MLLDFPPELIQLVLLNCTTSSFLQTAFTCRALYEIASGCREALIHHLRRTPGPPLAVSSLNTSLLFPLLRRRAFQQLHGSQFDASCVTLTFGDQIPNVKASSLASYGDESIIFTTGRDPRTVHILQVRQGQIIPFAQARLPWTQPGLVQILKTAFDGHDRIYILHRLFPHIEEHDPDIDHPFVKEARESRRGGLLYLTCHSLQSPNGPVRVSVFPELGEYDPSALTVANDGSFAIAWSHRMFSDHKVVLYTIEEGSEYDVGPDLVGK
jgi:hypothetical protein